MRQWEKRAKQKKKIRRIFTAAGAGVLAAALVVAFLYNYTDTLQVPSPTLNSNPADGQWSMFRHDLLHSGATGNNSMLPQGQVQWTFTTKRPIYSSPTVVDGIVYFGSEDGTLYALDAVSGNEVWEYPTGVMIDSSPTVVDGIVYFGSHDGNLYALNSHTGKIVWDFFTIYPVDSSPAVAGGVVYFGTGDCHLYALNSLTGKKLWAFKVGDPVYISPVVANGIVYFGSGDSWMYALRADNGQFRLHYKTYVKDSSPAMSGKTVYFGDQIGNLWAINGQARSWFDENQLEPVWLQLWAMGVAPKPPPLSGSLWGYHIGQNQIGSSPAIMNSKLFVGVDNNLVAVDLANGKPLWSLQTGDFVKSSPVVAGNTIYIGSDDGKVYAVDATSGQEIWHITTGDKVESSPALADGILYVGSFDGKLYAIK